MALKLSMFTIQSLPTLAFPPMMNFSSPKVSMVSTLYPSTKQGENLKKSSVFPQKMNVEFAHPMSPEKVEIFKSMEDWTRENILTLLKPIEKSWHPQDFLPDPASDRFIEQVNELRERTKDIPDDYFVVLVGSMITEKALPTYHTRINSIDIFQDETGIDNTPWAIWNRSWSSEENRHGDLLNKYIYLSGRVDMKQVAKTIQYLIRSGTDLGWERNPYLLTIYTSFQERATFISHGNTAKLAMQYGDRSLAQICGTIASDEKRHEIAYTRIVKKLFELDPNETVMALAHMMRRKMAWPAHFMYDGRDENLPVHFSNVSSRIGTYSTMDYINVLEHLVAEWNVEKVTGLSSDGQQAQDYVCGLARRIRRMEEKAQESAKQAPNISFSSIFDREV